MNKVKLMIAFMFCCAIGYVGFTTYGKVTMSEAEKFMLANVEALTDGESGVGSVVIIFHFDHCVQRLLLELVVML